MDKLFGRASDRRDGTSLENLLTWMQHPLSALCSQQSFLRRLRSPVYGFNANKRSSRSKVNVYYSSLDNKYLLHFSLFSIQASSLILF